jgi:hypothetical protein
MTQTANRIDMIDNLTNTVAQCERSAADRLPGEATLESFFARQARPTPEGLDELAERYNVARLSLAAQRELVAGLEETAIALVNAWGVVVPRAEKSRRLTGKLSEFTVTKADTLTIDDSRVETLKDALYVNGYGPFFHKLFAERKKWEVIEGAEALFKSESLPKRLSEKVLNLWGRCIGVKAKKPSLRVTLADPAKPAKKAAKESK